MIQIKSYLAANWLGVSACIAWALLEWALPRVKFLKANSTVELLANVAKKMLLDRIPLVGRFVNLLATPTAADAPKEETE